MATGGTFRPRRQTAWRSLPKPTPCTRCSYSVPTSLLGCVEGSEEEAELKLIAETVMAYEAKRWPDGKVPGGKG